MRETTEFSFILKPTNHGIGVFATHSIIEGTPLRLLGPTNNDFVERRLEDVPSTFRKYCLKYDSEKMVCPRDFGQMSLEWFLNHAPQSIAAIRTFDGVNHVAAKDLSAGDELTIDYNCFGEDASLKDSFY